MSFKDGVLHLLLCHKGEGFKSGATEDREVSLSRCNIKLVHQILHNYLLRKKSPNVSERSTVETELGRVLSFLPGKWSLTGKRSLQEHLLEILLDTSLYLPAGSSFAFSRWWRFVCPQQVPTSSCAVRHVILAAWLQCQPGCRGPISDGTTSAGTDEV